MRRRRTARSRRHQRRSWVADQAVDLGRRVVGRVREPLERRVSAAGQREPRAAPGLETMVLLGAVGARERAWRAGDERPHVAALDEAKQATKVLSDVGMDLG